MKQFSCLKALYLSFYSREFYRDVERNWSGGVLLYLLLLLFICWSVLMFRVQPAITLNMNSFANAVVSQMPHSMIISNGIVTTPEKRPYLIADPDTKEVFAVIDTSGQFNTLEQAHARMLLTKDTLTYVDNNEIKIKKLSTDLTLNIDTIKIKETVLRFSGWLWILILPFLLIGSFLYRLVESLLYAVMGKIFAAASNINLPYFDVMKLTIVALTPTIIIGTILAWFSIEFRFQLLFYFVLSMAYMIFAIRANKNTAVNLDKI
ncbi:MAG: DUF1189 family protein [Gammaproteobacteria bacterium]